MVSSRANRWSIARLFIAVMALALMGSAQALAGPADELAAAHRHVGTAHRNISAGKEVSARANMERAQIHIRRSGLRVPSSRVALGFIEAAEAQLDARPRRAKRALQKGAKRLRRAIREERRREASESVPRPDPAPTDGSTQPAPVGATPPPSSTPPIGEEGSGGLVPPTSSPPPEPGGATLQDPFAADSIWNTPIPANPALEEGQTAKSATIAGYGGNTPLATTRYGVAVHLADSTTPKVRVNHLTNWFGYSFVNGVPVTENDTPAGGSDKHTVFVNQDDRCVYEGWIWNEDQNSSRSFGILPGGLDGDGIYPGGASMNAAGSSMLGGLVWPSEIRAGRIEHALTFSLNNSDVLDDGVAVPFTHSTSGATGEHALPFGARIQLDPSFDVSTINDPVQRIIAKALQEYGAYNRDNGGTLALYGLANPEDHPTEPSWDDVGVATPYDQMSEIPWDRFRVLDYDLQSGGGSLAGFDGGGCGSFS